MYNKSKIKIICIKKTRNCNVGDTFIVQNFLHFKKDFFIPYDEYIIIKRKNLLKK